MSAALLLSAVAAVPAAAQMPGGAPQSPPGALHRYYSDSTTTHWVTPTPVSGNFSFEQTLGFLHTTAAAGRVAIFGCRSGAATPAARGSPAAGAIVPRHLQGGPGPRPVTTCSAW